MTGIKKNLILGLFVSHIFIFNIFAQSEINISPIVQIVSYTDIYGKYPQIIGWGSATIINNAGVIISNNHVVDNGKGPLASIFGICITKELNKKPVCDYTASLIDRDDKLDISILKINELDIYGNNVDYSKFKTLDINYEYVPKNQDETIAIGYPWIGADTITETKGVVSGISEYNGYKFIKSDTLIASGNSGGAFIKDGELIGIPTFGIGGGGENTMGYALLISEAKDFINKNIHKKPIKNPINTGIDFHSYKKEIAHINNNFKLQDDIFDVSLLEDYYISNYIKNNSFTIELQKQKNIGVNYLSIYLTKAPQINDERSKLYFFEVNGLYSKDTQKLMKKNINGIQYFYPIDKFSLSDRTLDDELLYFTIENGYLITIYLEAPLDDEKRNKETQEEIEKLLQSIKINTNNFFKINQLFATDIPKVEIKTFPNVMVDISTYKFYLGNLYENIEIIIDELYEQNGKGKTVEEIYNVQLKDIDDSLKSKIIFKGLDGFIYCGGLQDDTIEIPSTDEKGNLIQLETCHINIYFPFNEELNRHYYISLRLLSLKNNTKKNIGIAIEFLKKYLKIDGNSDEVNIPNILKNQVKLNFKDIGNQTEGYKNFLKLLVTYNMIENVSYFHGDDAITWGNFLDIYMRYVYNFDLSLSQCDKKNYKCKFTEYKLGDKSLDIIFQELGIEDYNEYIDSEKMIYFDTILNYKLALGKIGNGTMVDFLVLQNLIDEEKNRFFKEKINNFNYNIYGDNKILLSDFYLNYSSTYFTTKNPRFYPDFDKLVYVNNHSYINFGSKKSLYEIELSKLNQQYTCDEIENFSDYIKCNNAFDEKYQAFQAKYLENKDLVGLDEQYYFTPLTKAEAIEKIFTQVDFGLFNKKLELKKGIIIE